MQIASFHTVPTSSGFLVKKKVGGREWYLYYGTEQVCYEFKRSAEFIVRHYEQGFPCPPDVEWVPVSTKYQGGVGVSRMGMQMANAFSSAINDPRRSMQYVNR